MNTTSGVRSEEEWATSADTRAIDNERERMKANISLAPLLEAFQSYAPLDISDSISVRNKRICPAIAEKTVSAIGHRNNSIDWPASQLVRVTASELISSGGIRLALE